MIAFTLQHHIAAPVDKVWEVLADFPGVYQWAPPITHSERVGTPSQGVGAARACTVPGFGRIEERITEWSDLHYRYEWAASGPVKDGSTTWRVRKDGKGTMVAVAIEANMRFGPLGRLMGVLMVRPKMTSLMRTTLSGLDHFVRTGSKLEGR